MAKINIRGKTKEYESYMYLIAFVLTIMRNNENYTRAAKRPEVIIQII